MLDVAVSGGVGGRRGQYLLASALNSGITDMLKEGLNPEWNLSNFLS